VKECSKDVIVDIASALAALNVNSIVESWNCVESNDDRSKERCKFFMSL
jgi:hypothetical protein